MIVYTCVTNVINADHHVGTSGLCKRCMRFEGINNTILLRVLKGWLLHVSTVQRNLQAEHRRLALKGCKAIAGTEILRPVELNIQIKVFVWYAHPSKYYEWPNLKFRYSQWTLCHAENRRASELCPTQTLRTSFCTVQACGVKTTSSVTGRVWKRSLYIFSHFWTFQMLEFWRTLFLPWIFQ
jgi:hypothetical protein